VHTFAKKNYLIIILYLSIISIVYNYFLALSRYWVAYIWVSLRCERLVHTQKWV
jgi:hypothetical protein